MKHGLLSNISKATIYHLCNGGSHSSGSPILLLESKKIIGIILGIKGDKNYNLGIFIKPLIIKLYKMKKINKLENKRKNKSCIKNLHISKEDSNTLVYQMQNSIYNIHNNRKKGVGFFCLFPYDSKILPFLITNEQVLNANDLNNNKNIMISLKNYKKENIFKNINIEKKE